LGIFPVRQRLICIADIASIYFINGKFGVSFRLQQCLVYPSETLKPFAFVGVEQDLENAKTDSEGDEAAETEEGDSVDEGDDDSQQETDQDI
jgi:hypothetical protein